MARPKSYRELIVWQKAMALARQAYTLSQGLPKSEAYGLLTQIRRAAVSVPSNIAEGHGRLSDLQFRHFLGNARGSLYEMQTQLELAGDLGYLDEKLVREMMEHGSEVARLINGLISVLSDARAVKKADTQALPTNSANHANSARTADEGFYR
jgi:four helix bundle protein